MIELLEGSRTVGPHGIDAIALALIVSYIICDLGSSYLCLRPEVTSLLSLYLPLHLLLWGYGAAEVIYRV
jgi:hypothetical protein